VKKTAGSCFLIQGGSINIIELTAYLNLNYTVSRIIVTQYQVVTSDNHHKLYVYIFTLPMTSCCICFSVLVSKMVLITVLWNYATSLWKICCGSVFCLVYRAKDKCHSDRLGLAVLFSTMKTELLLYLSSICLESDGVYIASTRLSTLKKKVLYIYKYAINNITTTVKKKQKIMPHVPIVNMSLLMNHYLGWISLAAATMFTISFGDLTFAELSMV